MSAPAVISHKSISQIWRHATTLGDVEIVAETSGGRHVCALWCNGRRLDMSADATDLARLIGEGAYDLLLGWPLSRMGVPLRLSEWDEGGVYDPHVFMSDDLARWGCDLSTLAA